MAYDDRTIDQLVADIGEWANLAENALQGVMRRVAEIERRKGAAPTEPAPVAPEPTPEPSPPPVEEPEPDPIEQPAKPPVVEEPDIDDGEPVGPPVEDLPPPKIKPIPDGEWITADSQPEIAVLSQAEIDALLGAARIPDDMGRDPVGAFRFVGQAVGLARHDPITRPGQDNSGHLHTKINNPFFPSDLTYETMRRNGDCQSQGGNLNRTSEWGPTLTGILKASKRRFPMCPARIGRYYKAVPDVSQWGKLGEGFQAWAARINDEERAWFEAHPLVDLPAGLRFIAGYRYGHSAFNNKLLKADGKTVSVGGKNVKSLTAKRFADLLPHMEAGDHLYMGVHSPDLWDGIHIDSPDHTSHIVHHRDDDRRFVFIDGGKRTTKISYLWHYILPEEIELDSLAYSSDLELEADYGSTPHVGYIEGFEPSIRRRYFENAIQKQLNCNSFNLGDGFMGLRPDDFEMTAAWDKFAWDEEFYDT